MPAYSLSQFLQSLIGSGQSPQPLKPPMLIHLGPYDTPLSPYDEAQFRVWKNKYAPKDSGFDYDLRGAFKAGLTPDPVTGHWPDTFKKPNHPTFSVESKYLEFAPDKAGSWVGPNHDIYVPPKQ